MTRRRISEIRSLIDNRLPTAGVPRITAAEHREVLNDLIDSITPTVLASDISLAAGPRTTHALAAPLDDFRWVQVIWGEDSGQIDYGSTLWIPREAITARVVDVGQLLGALQVSARNFQLYSIDPGDGVLTSIGDVQNLPAYRWVGGLAYHERELLALLGNGSNRFRVHTVDVATGVMTAEAQDSQIMPGNYIGLTSHDSELLALSANSTDNTTQLYVVDPATSHFTVRGNEQAQQFISGIGLASHGSEVFALLEVAGNVLQLFTVNTQTGVLTIRGAEQAQYVNQGLGLTSHNGELLALLETLNNTVSLFLVDTQTGALTARGSAQSQAVLDLSIGLASTGSVSGQIEYGTFRIDRAGPSSLGVQVFEDRYISQIIGIL